MNSKQHRRVSAIFMKIEASLYEPAPAGTDSIALFRRRRSSYLLEILKFSGLCCDEEELDLLADKCSVERFIRYSVELLSSRSVELPRTRRSVEPLSRCSVEPLSRCSEERRKFCSVELRLSCSVEPLARYSVEAPLLRRYSAEMGILLGLGRRLLVGLTDSPSGLVRRILL